MVEVIESVLSIGSMPPRCPGNFGGNHFPILLLLIMLFFQMFIAFSFSQGANLYN